MTHDPYAPQEEADLADLVRAQPLAWVVSLDVEGPLATLLPLRPVCNAGGAVVRLEGHFARRNPQVETLRKAPEALLLFLGAHGYMSPSWLADRSQAPTWNYASAQFRTRVELYEDEPSLQAHLRDLIGASEAGRERAWSLDEVGARYERLIRGIVGFRATVLTAKGKFKLGQDERDDVYADMIAGVRAGGAADLDDWMTRFNRDRES